MTGKEKKAAYQRGYTRRFKEEHGFSTTTFYRRKNPDAAQRHRSVEKSRWASNPTTRLRHRDAGWKHRRLLKTAAYGAYGGFICWCCGEQEELFLTIDHINNDGAAHRKALKSPGSTALYKWLRDNNYPEGFRVLCSNCNVGRYRNGGECPHEGKR